MDFLAWLEDFDRANWNQHLLVGSHLPYYLPGCPYHKQNGDLEDHFFGFTIDPPSAMAIQLGTSIEVVSKNGNPPHTVDGQHPAPPKKPWNE